MYTLVCLNKKLLTPKIRQSKNRRIQGNQGYSPVAADDTARTPRRTTSASGVIIAFFTISLESYAVVLQVHIYENYEAVD